VVITIPCAGDYDPPGCDTRTRCAIATASHSGGTPVQTPLSQRPRRCPRPEFPPHRTYMIIDSHRHRCSPTRPPSRRPAGRRSTSPPSCPDIICPDRGPAPATHPLERPITSGELFSRTSSALVTVVWFKRGPPEVAMRTGLPGDFDLERDARTVAVRCSGGSATKARDLRPYRCTRLKPASLYAAFGKQGVAVFRHLLSQVQPDTRALRPTCTGTGGADLRRHRRTTAVAAQADRRRSPWQR